MKLKHIIIPLVILLLIVSGSIVGVYMVRQQQLVEKDASTTTGVATLTLSPASRTVNIGDSTPMNIELQVSNNDKITTFDLNIKVDHPEGTPFTISAPSLSSALSGWTDNVKTTTPGNGSTTINFGASTNDPAGYSSQGKFILGTVTMAASGNGTATVTVNPGSRVFNQAGNDILSNNLPTVRYTAGTTDPTATPTPTNTPTPTKGPTSTPRPTSPPNQNGKALNLDLEQPTCTVRNFPVTVRLDDNGTAPDGVQVSIMYQNRRTNFISRDGIAEGEIAYAGPGSLAAEASGYPTSRITIVDLSDCPPDDGDNNSDNNSDNNNSDNNNDNNNDDNDSSSTTHSRISLTNIVNGARLTDTTPTFNGTAPANSDIDIEINSGEPITGYTTANTAGIWSWTVPSPLEIGQHSGSFTATHPDGQTSNVSINFTIASSSGSLPTAGNATTSLIIIGMGMIFIATGFSFMLLKR